VIDRRYFVPLAAIVAIVVALAAALAWWLWDPHQEASLAEPVAVNATLAPQQHLFGDPVRARVDLILDTKQVDPDTVKVRASFAPYRPLHPPKRSEISSGAITQLRLDYQLACLGYRCLPTGRRRMELRKGTVEYRRRGDTAVQTEEIDWPILHVTGRISPTRFWEAQLRAEYRELGPPTYRVSPRLVEVVALVLAVIFAAAALILVLRLLPLAAIAERLGLMPVDRRTPLERALARVHETATAERPDEGRRALERLARELRRSRSPELAGAASQLAWSRDFPADGRLTALTGKVERLISEKA
jgi:hypothetical protein